MTQPIYLIDASIYIFRAWFAVPDEWYSPEGDSVNALYGYVHFIFKFLQQTKPRCVAAAYDESLGSCFRNEIYAEYKSSRELPDAALAFQLAACKAFTETMGIVSPASVRYEADDIIASLAARVQQQGGSVSIVSRDKDLGQLLKSDDDHLWDFAADKRIYKSNFSEHFQVNPNQMTDFLALVGDPIDDIPGVPGIGKKTAAILLQQFGSIDGLYKDLDAVAACGIRGAKGIAIKLKDYAGQLRMAQDLVRLEINVPLVGSEQLRWQPPAVESVRYFLEEFGLGKSFERHLATCYWWK